MREARGGDALALSEAEGDAALAMFEAAAAAPS
jgi:hypothetical protein